MTVYDAFQTPQAMANAPDKTDGCPGLATNSAHMYI
jgi:hypothetical protein